jgi:hypothetical protein
MNVGWLELVVNCGFKAVEAVEPVAALVDEIFHHP